MDSLWCLKLGLLAFYSRFIDVFRWGKILTDALWWFIIATFVAVFITILAECRPISLYVFSVDNNYLFLTGSRMWALNRDDSSKTTNSPQPEKSLTLTRQK